MEAILHELVDCENRKERKKLVKQALELFASKDTLQANNKKSAVAVVIEEEKVVEEKKAKKSKKEREPVVVEEEAEEEPKKDKKKKKRDLEAAQETDKEPATPVAEEASFVNGNEEEEEYYPEEKKRFSRIKDEQKSFQEALIQDNTYDAVFAGTGYGAKANDKLKTVRGKDFRHEKTKKKRGSYRGGAIDDEVVNSVEFSD